MRHLWFATFSLGLATLAAQAHAQESKQSEREARKAYPDFALQAPPINTAPGPEYASWTRMSQEAPSIERSATGRLWAAWSAYEGPMKYVLLVSSGDDGKTWSEPKLVIDPPGNVVAYNPGLWRDPLGRLWLFWRQEYGGWDGRGGAWAIVSENLDVEKPAWSRPQRLADGLPLNKPTVLTSGEWLLPVAVPTGACGLPGANEDYKLGLSPSVIMSLCHDLGEQKGLNVYSSVDKGKTWKLVGQAGIPDACCEHMIVERHDGSLWMLARTYYGIGQSISTDGGKTWGQSGESGIRHPVTRFFIRRLKSGSLLMVRHNPLSIRFRSHLTAYVSDNDGKTWYGGLLLDERNSVSYPDGVEADDGKIYVIYDRGRFTDREILMATFTEEDVKQGKCVTGQCELKMLVNKGGE